MEMVIVSAICMMLIIFGGMTMSQGFISSVDTSTPGWREISDRDGEIMRTELALLTADISKSRKTLEVASRNSGQTKLNDFAQWDVIVQYYDDGGSYYTKWLPYTEGSPDNNEWTVQGIYLNSENETAEVFEPGILNPGEETVMQAILWPPAGKGTTNDVVISTPNGVRESISFTVPGK